MDIIGDDFVFGDHTRWRLLWEDPNQAAIVAAMLLSISFSLLLNANVKRWKVVLTVLCGVLIFLVCKTYSRGGLIAAVAGCVYGWVSTSAFANRGFWRREFVVPAFIASLSLILLVCVTGFLQRIELSSLINDKSVISRFELFSATPKLLNLNALSGVGRGWSGYEYCNWFQSYSSGVKYTSVVSGWLTLAVELGVLVLTVILIPFVMTVLILFVGKKSEQEAKLLSLSGAVLICFFFGNVTSNFFYTLSLCFMPVIAGVFVATKFLCILAGGNLWKWGGILLLCSTFPASVIFLSDADYVIEKRDTSQYVIFDRDQTRGGKTAALLIDTSSFMGAPGKFARRIFEQRGSIKKLYVFTLQPKAIPVDCEIFIVTGRYSGTKFPRSERVIWFLPETVPDITSNSFLILSRLDQWGVNSATTIAAKEAGSDVHFLPVSAAPISESFSAEFGVASIANLLNK